MEKVDDSPPARRALGARSRGLGIRFLAAPLLAFLLLYNVVPSVHDSVQSFFSLHGWNIEQLPLADTAQGTFVGKVLDNNAHPIPVEAWLGIPYALPPLGDLRFAKPVPVPDSNETIQATEYSLRYGKIRGVEGGERVKKEFHADFLPVDVLASNCSESPEHHGLRRAKTV